MKIDFRFLLPLFLLLTVQAFSQCPPPSCPTGNCYCINDQTVADLEGTLYDDGGPNNDYQSDGTVISRTFTIQGTVATPISLQFTSFAFENSITCEYDYLEVLDGGVSQGIFCGSNNPGVITCTSGTVIIRTFSDPNTVAAGFEMNWFTDSIPPEATNPTGGYCAGDGDCGNGMGIYEVIMEGDNGGFTSTSDLADCQNNGGYSDYTQDFLASLTEGNPYLCTIGSNSNGYFAGQIAVYVDWNEDFDFDDDLELVSAGPTSQDFQGVRFEAAITPPMGTTAGYKRMRIVSCSCADVPGPCGTTGLGEYEDYTVKVGSPPPFCAENFTPSQVTGVCQKENTLTWEGPSSGEEPTGYILYFGSNTPPDNIEDSLDVGLATSYDVDTLLDANKTYYWQVVPYNDAGLSESCEIQQFTVSSFGDPTAEISNANISDKQLDLCSGNNAALMAENLGGSAPFTYQWSGDRTDLLSSEVDQTVSFDASEIGSFSYEVRIEDDNGCFGLDSITINTTQNATSGTISGTTVVCADDNNTILYLNNEEGEIQWQKFSSNNGWQNVVEANLDSLVVSNAGNGERFRAYTTIEACSDTTEITTLSYFSVAPAPQLSSATGSLSFCENDTLELNTSQLPAIWSTGANTDSILVSNAGTYFAQYTDANGCLSDTGRIEVTQTPAPEKGVIMGYETEDAQVNLCANESVVLSIEQTDLDIAWNGQTANRQRTFVVTPALAGDVFVRLTDRNGCSSFSDTGRVNFIPFPEPPVILTQDDTVEFCDGQDFVLSIESSLPTIFWNDNTALSGDTLVINRAGMYHVTVANEFGCATTTDPIEIRTLESPEVPPLIIDEGSPEFCEGEQITLSTLVFEPVFWNGNPAINTYTIVADTSGIYYLTSTGENGCQSTSDSLEVIVNPLPETPILTSVNGDLQSSVTDSLLTYTWFTGDNTLIPEVTGPIYENAPDGVFFLVVTNPETGCASQSETLTGILDLSSTENIKVFPNPVPSGAAITVKTTTVIDGLMLTDLNGKQIHSSNSMSIGTTDIPSGVYQLFGLVNGETAFLAKVVIE